MIVRTHRNPVIIYVCGCNELNGVRKCVQESMRVSVCIVFLPIMIARQDIEVNWCHNRDLQQVVRTRSAACRTYTFSRMPYVNLMLKPTAQKKTPSMWFFFTPTTIQNRNFYLNEFNIQHYDSKTLIKCNQYCIARFSTTFKINSQLGILIKVIRVRSSIVTEEQASFINKRDTRPDARYIRGAFLSVICSFITRPCC